MQGLMMDVPLSITSVMRHAERNHGEREVVSLTADGGLHRYTYVDAFRRVRRLANALSRLDLAPGDRVATDGWRARPSDRRSFRSGAQPSLTASLTLTPLS